MAVDLAQIIPPLVRALTLNMETACPQAAFHSEVILFTSALVPFSKSIPYALRTARVGIQINRNAQIGTSRMRSPSQMTYGW